MFGFNRNKEEEINRLQCQIDALRDRVCELENPQEYAIGHKYTKGGIEFVVIDSQFNMTHGRIYEVMSLSDGIKYHVTKELKMIPPQFVQRSTSRKRN